MDDRLRTVAADALPNKRATPAGDRGREVLL